MTLQRTMSAPEKRCAFPEPAPPQTKSEEKERHSSGDSAISSNDENSASVSNVGTSSSVNDVFVDARPKTTASDVLPVRGILKRSLNRPRCFSESDQAGLMTSPSLSSCISIDSSIPEEDESAFAAESGEDILSLCPKDCFPIQTKLGCFTLMINLYLWITTKLYVE